MACPRIGKIQHFAVPLSQLNPLKLPEGGLLQLRTVQCTLYIYDLFHSVEELNYLLRLKCYSFCFQLKMILNENVDFKLFH